MSKTIKIIFGLIVLLVLINAVSAVSKSINVNVIETRNISLAFTHVNNIDNFDVVVDRNSGFLHDTYPLSDDGLNITKDIFGVQGPEDLLPNEDDAVAQLLDIRIDILSKEYLKQQEFTNVIGIVKENYLDPLSATGINFNLGKADLILTDETQLKTTAHEVGHTFELCDEYRNSTWIKQNKKIDGGCPNGDLDGDGNLDAVCLDNSDYPGLSGCPTQTFSKLFEAYGNINDTTPLRNIMGSSDPPDFSTTPPSDFETWISNNSYDALLDRLDLNSSFIIPQLPFVEIEGEYIIVRINYSKEGDANLLDSHILEDGFIHNSSLFSGNFTIEILNESDEIISNISFEPEFTITTEVGDDIETNQTFIIFALPLNNQTPSKIVFKNLTSTIAEVNRTPNTPSLSLLFPTGGELISQQMTIEYDATDADDDTINYAILISADNGATFSTLVVDHPNKTFFLNTTPFQDNNEYKIKILATDGINTDTEISGTFTINNSLEVIPGTIILKKVKTKCGEDAEKDYIRIHGTIEDFEPSTDFTVEIDGNPAIFGPVTVTIPLGTKTITIPGGKVQASFPNEGIGNFHINVDANNLNECPDGVDEADLTLKLNGVEKTITLEREKNSKFFSTRNPIGILGLASWWSPITGMVTFIKQYIQNF